MGQVLILEMIDATHHAAHMFDSQSSPSRVMCHLMECSVSDEFFSRGWVRFPEHPDARQWIDHALPHARMAARDADNAHWLRHGGTWFAGVNALPNDHTGRLVKGPALAGPALDFIRDTLGFETVSWDRGQISICYPGYPQKDASETDAAHRYRRNRDAAHLDGLMAEGPARRRHIREYHGFLLGIPLTDANAGASPFVIWEGSHHVIRQAFQDYLRDIPVDQWPDIDLTDIYQETRRRIFDICPRRELPARPGDMTVIHRLAIHGVAPWDETATAGPDGRMIIYFRPETGTARDWLDKP